VDRKYRSSSWVDPRIAIREAPGRGKGSFALAPIGAGEIVTIWGGQVFTLAEIQAGKARKKSLVAIGKVSTWGKK
jgi:transcription elongation factor